MRPGVRVVAVVVAVALCVIAPSARADDASAASAPFPRSPDLVPEPTAKPWGAQASVSRTSFEIYLAASPIGWSFGEDGTKYGALARAGMGLMRATERTLLMSYVSYEVSRLSYVTFGLHANLIGLPRDSWAQGFGGGLALYVQPSGTIGVGLPVCWLATCLEFQYRDDDQLGKSVTAYLELTTGILSMRDEMTYLRRTE